MKATVFALDPLEFVEALGNQDRIWRRSSGHAGPGAKRHRRNLRRKWIQRYKRMNGITRLPGEENLQISFSALAEQTPVEPVLVILPENESHSLEDRRPAELRRKKMRRILHTATNGKKLSIELVNSANSSRTPIPPLRSYRTGKNSRLLRGIYLEAIGAAIVPDPGAATISSLRELGADVLPNATLTFSMPEVHTDETPEEFWHLAVRESEAGKAVPYSGRGVSIGILDTGIDEDHGEFAHKTINFQAFSKNGLPRKLKKARDFGTHGTHVSAICGGRRAGIAPNCHLSVAAVLTNPAEDGAPGEEGTMEASLLQLTAGLNWLAKMAGPDGRGVDIINASLGINGEHVEIVRRLYGPIETTRLDRGNVVVAAIGNSGRNGVGNHCMPAKFDNVIAVGAIDRQSRIADFSSWGPALSPYDEDVSNKPDLVAPGVEINSAVPGGKYGVMSGTSMAAPVVSGILALLLEADPELQGEPERLTQKLLAFTDHFHSWSENERLRAGRGRVTLSKLI